MIVFYFFNDFYVQDPEQVTTTKQQPTELPSLTEIKNTHFQILSKGVPEAVHPEIVIFLDDSFCK